MIRKFFLPGLGLVLLALLPLSIWGASNAPTTIIIVTTTEDEQNSDGDCSLREAFTAANTDAEVDGCARGNGLDTIQLSPGTYTITNSRLQAQTGIILTTSGNPADTELTGNDAFSLIEVRESGDLTIEGLTLRNGNANSMNGSANGGAILIERGSLTLINSIVRDNVAASNGGAIFSDDGTLTIENSTIADNEAQSFRAGGIMSNGGSFSMLNSTVSGNQAGTDGGGLYVESDASILSSTITGNTADSDVDDSGDGGGFWIDGTYTTEIFGNNIVAGNSDNSPTGDVHADCTTRDGNTLSSAGNNLVEDVTGCPLSGETASNITGQDPLLGPLQDNGGNTTTHALQAGSPAIDAGPAGADCPGTDQRGRVRPVDGDTNGSSICDIGSVESGSALVATATPTSLPTSTPSPTPDPCSDGTEPNGTPAKATDIQAAVAVSGYICVVDDLDYYRLDVDSGDEIIVDLTNLAGNYFLRLYDPSLNNVGFDTSSGTDPKRIRYTATESGTWYVRVEGFDSAFSSSQPYRLLVSTHETYLSFIEESN